MNKTIKILFVEDVEDDAALIVRELRRGGFTPEICRVETREDYLERLKDPDLQLIFSDYFLPQFNGIEALHLLNKSGRDVPFMLASGTVGEHLAVESMRAGARDYFLKDNLTRLVPAVKRELLEAEARKQKRESEEKERRFQQQLSQSQKLESLGTLAGGIAHDFNNMLMTILGNLELAELDLPKEHPVRDYLEEAAHASGRAKDLVQQILTFSRRQGVERHAMHLAPVINEALKLLRASLPTTIQIQKILADDCPQVRANATQVSQVVMNLCMNAAHAVGEKAGRIEITCRPVQVEPTETPLHPLLKPGTHVRLSVRDNGEGMSADTLARIFEPFFTTKEPGQGTGLGLAVVHGIVEAHDGVITAESRPGEGTTFHVYFPALAEAEKLETKPVLEKYHGEGEHILFVDDDKSIVHLARAILKRMNYRIRAFDQPEEALAAFLEEPERYSLVIADLTMPKMTGDQLARHIGKVRKDLPVLIITGYGGSLELENILRSGLRDVLFKPFSNDQLAERIFRLLERARLVRSENPEAITIQSPSQYSI